MMKKASRIFTGMLFTTALAAFSANVFAGEISIVYTNDVHCEVNADEEKGVLGYAKVAGIRNELESEGKTVLLVDSGDALQGGVIGTLSNGEYIVDIMNAMKYDVAIPGNHEFDYGMEQFLSLVDKAEYEYVSANFKSLETGETILPPYVIKEAGDKKIAFVGASTPKTFTSSTPVFFQDDEGNFIYSFCQSDNELYDTIQAAVDSAREEGADYVILLAHLGIEAECSPWMSTEVIENTTGIDAVLDGHSHSILEEEQVTNKEGKKVLLTSTGTKLASVGTLEIEEDGTMHSYLITETEAADPEVEEAIAEINTEFEAVLNEVVATTSFPLLINDPQTLDEEKPVRIVRRAETNLGDLCADAYLYSSGAQIALVNGGGVRVDIPEGDITFQQIISVHPFGNEMCMKLVPGQHILDALEMGAMFMPDENGGFLQVAGLTYEINMNVESSVQLDENGMFAGVTGDRRVQNVMVGEEPLDPEKMYTVASHNFMLKNGGDGLCMFKDDELILDCVKIDNRVLIDYLVEGLGGVVSEEYAEPYGQGRIVAIEEE